MHPFRYHWLVGQIIFTLGSMSCATISAQSMESGDGPGGSIHVRDSLLVGKWQIIESTSLEGKRNPESFEIEYRPDGKASFNKQAIYRKFNQSIIRSGGIPFAKADLDRHFPKVTWKTDQDRIILTFKSRLGTNELTYHYQINGDTLTTVNAVFAGTRRKQVAVRRQGGQ